MEKTTVPPTFAEKDLNYYLRMVRGDFAELEEMQTLKVGGPSSQRNIVILMTSDALGTGNAELGRRLARFFLQSLINNRIKPKSIILMNSAVNLAAAGSDIIGKFAVLQEQGIKILVCAISADEYKVEDKIEAGSLADMDAIAEQLLTAWKVISL